MTDEAKRFNIAEHVGRYCLTYEQWLDHAEQDPEGYGMTKEQVIAEREHYNACKANTQQGTDNGTPEKA